MSPMQLHINLQATVHHTTCVCLLGGQLGITAGNRAGDFLQLVLCRHTCARIQNILELTHT